MKDSAVESGEAAFGVGGAIDDAADLGPAGGAGAHDTRFESDIEGAVVEIFGTQVIGGGGESHHLGVGGDIGEMFGSVVSAGQDMSLGDDDSADRDLVLIEGSLSLAESLLHKIDIGIVEDAHWGIVSREKNSLRKGMKRI